MDDEDIKVLKEMIENNKKYFEHKPFNKDDEDIQNILKRQNSAVENLLNRYQQYEEKLMFALSPTNHELALETQRNFKKIIMQNIDKDTYTIRKELKKYWDNMNTYWEEK